MTDNSEKHARAILADYVEAVSRTVDEHLEAIILTGSLATGSYIPGPGDIDQITILKESSPDDAVAGVQRIREAVLSNHERAINMADVVYRREDLARPWRVEYDLRPETRHHVTVPEELLRIADHGQVVCGNTGLTQLLEVPTVKEMIDYHRRWRRWNEEIKRINSDIAANSREPSVRLAVQSILSKAPWHYYFYSQGRTHFNKNTIADKIREAIPGYLFMDILDNVTAIRVSGKFTLSSAETKDIIDGYKDYFGWVGSHDVDHVPVR